MESKLLEQVVQRLLRNLDEKDKLLFLQNGLQAVESQGTNSIISEKYHPDCSHHWETMQRHSQSILEKLSEISHKIHTMESKLEKLTMQSSTAQTTASEEPEVTITPQSNLEKENSLYVNELSQDDVRVESIEEDEDWIESEKSNTVQMCERSQQEEKTTTTTTPIPIMDHEFGDQTNSKESENLNEITGEIPTMKRLSLAESIKELNRSIIGKEEDSEKLKKELAMAPPIDDEELEPRKPLQKTDSFASYRGRPLPTPPGRRKHGNQTPMDDATGKNPPITPKHPQEEPRTQVAIPFPLVSSPSRKASMNTSANVAREQTSKQQGNTTDHCTQKIMVYIRKMSECYGDPVGLNSNYERMRTYLKEFKDKQELGKIIDNIGTHIENNEDSNFERVVARICRAHIFWTKRHSLASNPVRNVQKAESEFSKLIDMLTIIKFDDVDYPEGRVLLGCCHFLQGNINNYLREYVQAEEHYKLAATYLPMLSSIFYNRAIMFVVLNRFDEALDDLNNCIQQYPLDWKYYLTRAHLYREQIKNHEKALSDYSSAIDLNEKDIESHLYRGILYSTVFERYDKAIDDFCTIINIGDESNGTETLVTAYLHRAYLYENILHDDSKAIEDYSKVIEIEENNVDALKERARLLEFKLHDYKKALQDYLRLMQTAKEHYKGDVERVKQKLEFNDSQSE